MREKFLQQASKEHSPGRRALLLIPAGFVFLGVLPAAILLLSALFDDMFGLPRCYYGAVNWIIGIIFLLAGAFLGVWSNYVQFTIGRGTPIPLMATQELLIQKPYSYCRNPMALGTIIAYSGVAVILGSIPAFALVFLGSAILLTYIKFLEEKEMVARFGKPYEMYRKTTPFIIPRLRRRD